ncbi:MAG: VWA domain-containing protein [Acidobacteria bacterium]|nr:MAG: VWA domain-containing protein [Acidobacteriota bacterium]PYX62595.1 MAG: VWA domain-containing protein [Acidobacteriota bacterium]
MSKLRPLPVLAAGLLLCSAVVALSAQSLPAAQSTSNADQDQSVDTLKVNVDVVQLFFNVKDKRGALIPSLAKSDFNIFEDGKPQTIKYFTAESNLPLTLGILIDSSGSQQRVLGMEKEVGSAFLNEILRPKDEAFVISFDVDVNLLQDFTNSSHLLRAALDQAKINAPPSSCGGVPGLGGGPLPCSSTPKGTVLYDAVYLAAHDELAREVGRKAMILLTDGQDEGSKLRIADAIEAAQKADSICYVLLIADRGFYGFGGYSGSGQMKKLAEETGGRVIEVGNKLDKLKQGFDQIAQELRTQYNIGYTPTNSKRDGTFRKVEIRAPQGYKVQARTGYYAMQRQ